MDKTKEKNSLLIIFEAMTYLVGASSLMFHLTKPINGFIIIIISGVVALISKIKWI